MYFISLLVTVEHPREAVVSSIKIQREIADRLRWLAERGCPVDILKVESSIRIEQQNRDDVTMLFDLPDGRTGCIFDLRIINEGPGPRSVRDLELNMPWADFGFQLLEDPKERGGRDSNNLYRFPGNSIEYPRNMVLNHVLLPDGILQPNYPKSGLLLGIGNPMSQEILHGAAFTGVLNIVTDRGSPGVCEMELWADRMSKPRTKLNKHPPQYEGLYGTAIRSGAPLGCAKYSRDSDVPIRGPRSAHQHRDGYIRGDSGKGHNTEKEQ
jgi:hypothetical protein